MKKIKITLLVALVFFWINFVSAKSELVSITKNSITAPYKYWKITKIENWKDGQNIYITTDKNEIYSTAVSIHDRVDDKWNNWLYLGSKIKIFYYDEVEKMNLLIWDVVEVVTDWLSENDENFLRSLEKEINKTYKEKINTILIKYEKDLNKIDSEKAIKKHNKILNKVDTIISNFLMEFPQDIGLPKKDAERFSKLSYLHLKLMKIDFHKNISSKNSDKTNCELEWKVWKKVWMLQTETCITEYTDWGKTCDSSSDCQWNCIVTYPDTPAVCAKNNDVFWCKNTIENVNKWEWIMCID